MSVHVLMCVICDMLHCGTCDMTSVMVTMYMHACQIMSNTVGIHVHVCMATCHHYGNTTCR